jgi:hypothetical protein
MKSARTTAAVVGFLLPRGDATAYTEGLKQWVTVLTSHLWGGPQ